MDQFVGKWSLTQSSKFEEYLSELGKLEYFQSFLLTIISYQLHRYWNDET